MLTPGKRTHTIVQSFFPFPPIRTSRNRQTHRSTGPSSKSSSFKIFILTPGKQTQHNAHTHRATVYRTRSSFEMLLIVQNVNTHTRAHTRILIVQIFILTPGDTRAKHHAHSLSTFHTDTRQHTHITPLSHTLTYTANTHTYIPPRHADWC